ncbi:ATP-binding cassette domain-containing protein [Mycoplasma bovis]|uniref:ATP-binding cassette domain-containing protein n=1 Tax=Mycoplasmopsis bovis TaxID=28903 RepID=UPI001BDF5BB2|nr:ATP-binding cassette domain-containing protein [Mycoplasmopsis bovis]MBT1336231.1 ATP-binding cassette domain-containing protein [Mycoplasmopsis bovis]MBT1415930.1 ATP-binding cassette domain-containing protein [Mycoplasmopsis bovis]MBT1417433.1 ATP-binding cassette domain-containing protein [Mycoplasmopsis bovis]UJB25766.1 ATP-binding cassette domain-containing protein [Mycoplasmopsis bovis]
MKNNDNKKVILEIQDLKKYFLNNGKVNKAVDGVSFKLHEGEIVGLIGESGSGKTTVGRSILRLYDDFNGFVTLDDQIISGESISKKREKFLRKRVQMIFQDPHASLNGQKTIYSILKEPLVVNNIIKQKTDDLFSDWKKVAENFQFTFLLYAKKLKIKNLKAINEPSSTFFPKWSDRLIDFKFDWENLSIDENFVSYFNYLEEKQTMESSIINEMYSNTDQLMAFYYEKQAQFRNNDVTFDELDYINATKELELTKKLCKYSQKQYDALNKLSELDKELKELKSNQNDYLLTNKNAFNNFLSEYKNEIKICRYARLNTYDIDFYFFNYKKELTNKIRLDVIKKYKSKLSYLSIDQIRKFIAELNKYTNSFYIEHLESLPISKDFKAVAKLIIESDYNFDVNEYLKLNHSNELEFNSALRNIEDSIKAQKEIIHSKDEKPAFGKKELEAAEQKLANAEKVFKAENDKYNKNIQNQIKQLDKDILNESLLYKNLKTQQGINDLKFKKINEAFFEKLNSDLKEAKAKKDHAKVHENNKTIKIYKQKVSNKLSTLKSFEVEVKHLFKDVRTIYLLLGTKQFENSLFNIYNRLFAKQMITKLITRSMIYKSLEDVGLLKQFAYRYPHEFSGGQRQRIVIARALITEPKVIVADEPIASLDISIQAQVVNLLKDLCEKKNIGMIFIAHDLSMIEYIADNVQIMHLGKIVESGDTATVYKRPLHPYTRNLFKAIPKISNANEKFENINFELDYLKEQQYPDIPSNYIVENDHYIYGTDKQVNEWVKPFRLGKPKNTDVIDAKDDDKK